jgi:hypothetical protein
MLTQDPDVVVTLEPKNAQPHQAIKLRKGNRRSKKILKYALCLSLVALLTLVAGGFFTFRQVKQNITDGTTHFENALASLKKLSAQFDPATLTSVRQEFASAQNDFQQARENTGLYSALLPLAESMPGVGYDVAHLPELLTIAEKSAQLGTVLIDSVLPSLNNFEQSNSGETNTASKLLKIAALLNDPGLQNRLALAHYLLARIETTRITVDATRLKLPQTQKALAQFDQQFPTLKEGVSLLRELSPLLPEILGQQKLLNYLTIIQNSDELRATGGFISAVGLLTLDNGKLSLSKFEDSYAVDNPKIKPAAPPEPLARYMQTGNFLLRDANWWPDFPTSARQMLNLYRQHQGQEVENLIALDSQAVAYIFEVLGPLDLPEYQEHLTAQNFQERLRYYYLPPGSATDGEWWLKRKAFIGVVMTGLMGKLEKGNFSHYVKLLAGLGRALQEKHLQIYSGQPALEKLLNRHGLDGAQTDLSAGTTDYLMLVDSNVGFNKVNPKIERTADYQVSYAGNGASVLASLTLTYTNRAGVREGTNPGECIKLARYDRDYESMMNGCYWDYLRVYVPPGSILRTASGFPAEEHPVTTLENNRTVFAGQLIVPPGQTVTINLSYLLPGQLAGTSAYRLSLQPQAGSPPLPITIGVILPGGSRSWTTRLDQDRRFDFQSKDVSENVLKGVFS